MLIVRQFRTELDWKQCPLEVETLYSISLCPAPVSPRDALQPVFPSAEASLIAGSQFLNQAILESPWGKYTGDSWAYQDTGYSLVVRICTWTQPFLSKLAKGAQWCQAGQAECLFFLLLLLLCMHQYTVHDVLRRISGNSAASGVGVLLASKAAISGVCTFCNCEERETVASRPVPFIRQRPSQNFGGGEYDDRIVVTMIPLQYPESSEWGVEGTLR